MRPIDADALIEKCGGWYVEEGTESGFIGTLKNLLSTMPTIQPEKAQLSQQGTTSDLISRTETVKRLRRMLEATVTNTDYDEGYVDGVEFGISTVSTMPPIQPVATDTNVRNNSEIPNSSNCISRQHAIDIVVFECGKWTGLAKEISKQLKQLPPAQPEVLACGNGELVATPEPQWIPCEDCERRCKRWGNLKTLQE